MHSIGKVQNKQLLHTIEFKISLVGLWFSLSSRSTASLDHFFLFKADIKPATAFFQALNFLSILPRALRVTWLCGLYNDFLSEGLVYNHPIHLSSITNVCGLQNHCLSQSSWSSHLLRSIVYNEQDIFLDVYGDIVWLVGEQIP